MTGARATMSYVRDAPDAINQGHVLEAASAMARRTLYKVKQQPNEDIRTFQNRVHSLFLLGFHGTTVLEEEARLIPLEYFILGLADDYVKQRVWEHRPRNLKEAADIALHITKGQRIFGAAWRRVSPKLKAKRFSRFLR